MTRCEDYPCCGHLAGECEDRPEFYAEYWANDPHLLCDHNTGYCEVEYQE